MTANEKHTELGKAMRSITKWPRTQSSETHVEGLVRKNHAQAANPTSDVSPWFEHGMTEFERELFYSVSETD